MKISKSLDVFCRCPPPQQISRVMEKTWAQSCIQSTTEIQGFLLSIRELVMVSLQLSDVMTDKRPNPSKLDRKLTYFDLYQPDKSLTQAKNISSTIFLLRQFHYRFLILRDTFLECHLNKTTIFDHEPVNLDVNITTYTNYSFIVCIFYLLHKNSKILD